MPDTIYDVSSHSSGQVIQFNAGVRVAVDGFDATLWDVVSRFYDWTATRRRIGRRGDL